MNRLKEIRKFLEENGFRWWCYIDRGAVILDIPGEEFTVRTMQPMERNVARFSERLAAFLANPNRGVEGDDGLLPIDWAILSAIPDFEASIDDRVEYYCSLNL